MKYLVLFASTTTLFCCALPALLVFLGFGAVLASLITTVPFLVTLSEYKLLTFSITAIMIGSSWLTLLRRVPCQIGEHQQACLFLTKKTNFILVLSTIIWITGFTVSIIIPQFI